MQAMRPDDGGSSPNALESVSRVTDQIPQLLRDIKSACDKCAQLDDAEIERAKQRVKTWQMCPKQVLEDFQKRYDTIKREMGEQQQRVDTMWKTHFEKHTGAPKRIDGLSKQWGTFKDGWNQRVSGIEGRQKNKEWTGPAADLYHFQLQGQHQASTEMVTYAEFTQKMVNETAKVHATIYLQLSSLLETGLQKIKEAHTLGDDENNFGRRMGTARYVCRWIVDEGTKLATDEGSTWRASLKDLGTQANSEMAGTKAFAKGTWPKATDEVSAGPVTKNDPTSIKEPQSTPVWTPPPTTDQDKTVRVDKWGNVEDSRAVSGPPPVEGDYDLDGTPDYQQSPRSTEVPAYASSTPSSSSEPDYGPTSTSDPYTPTYDYENPPTPAPSEPDYGPTSTSDPDTPTYDYENPPTPAPSEPDYGPTSTTGPEPTYN